MAVHLLTIHWRQRSEHYHPLPPKQQPQKLPCKFCSHRQRPELLPRPANWLRPCHHNDPLRGVHGGRIVRKNGRRGRNSGIRWEDGQALGRQEVERADGVPQERGGAAAWLGYGLRTNEEGRIGGGRGVGGVERGEVKSRGGILSGSLEAPQSVTLHSGW